MKLQTWTLTPCETRYTTGLCKASLILQLTSDTGTLGQGEIAPWNPKDIDIALEEVQKILPHLLSSRWSKETALNYLQTLNLLPSTLFGLESALLAILDPVNTRAMPTTALLMGTAQEILRHADLRLQEGYTIAKLKVSNLTLTEAEKIILQLLPKFRLRIDVNRAWTPAQSNAFFAHFPLDTFDYVEEPFDNPKKLAQFSHPLAIDESFPRDLSVKEILLLPTFKYLVYKPSLQGGLSRCQSLRQHKIPLVLSSSFESTIGLQAIKEMACRLEIKEPIGLGTWAYLQTGAAEKV